MTHAQPLAGKVAVVTGASRGLGRAMAIRLAADGALVAVNYRSAKDEAAQVVGEIEKSGGRAFAVQGDVSSVAEIVEFYGRLDKELQARTGSTGFDILIPNAGVTHSGTVAETDEAAFDKVFNLNVKGVFFVVQKGLERLRDGGRIITLSSGLTRFYYPQYIAYSSTKGAIDVMTKCLAKQLGGRGITVNAVAPGAIDTDMNAGWIRSEEGQQFMSSIAALGRVGMPDDISGVVAFLARDEAGWVTAQRIEASGGAHL
ncbi:MAG: SDR family oxidoreductase [Myxococcota bacterium]